MGPRSVSNVVINAHRKRIRFLEYHADTLPQMIDIQSPYRYLPRPTGHLLSIRHPSTRSFIRLMDFKNVDFPHPDGPINAVILFASEFPDLHLLVPENHHNIDSDFYCNTYLSISVLLLYFFLPLFVSAFPVFSRSHRKAC